MSHGTRAERDSAELDIGKLALLARLELEENEVDEIRNEIQALKRLIDAILEASIGDIPPLVHPLEKETRLREDREEKGISQEEALSNASGRENGFFQAPRIIEE